MNLNRFYLAASNLTPQEYYQMTKAKKVWVKEHNFCALCGEIKYLEVHHILPVHAYPHLAVDSTNFMTLCDYKNHGCHYIWGHFRNFRSKWNPHIREFVKITNEFYNDRLVV